MSITLKPQMEVNMEMEKTLLVQNAVTLKERFEQAISAGDVIIIDHKESEEFDLSYLQLLLSLDKYAIEIGKQIKYSGNQPESFRQLIKNSGLSVENWLFESNRHSEKQEAQNG